MKFLIGDRVRIIQDKNVRGNLVGLTGILMGMSHNTYASIKMDNPKEAASRAINYSDTINNLAPFELSCLELISRGTRQYLEIML
jgi:hypothetical protein